MSTDLPPQFDAWNAISDSLQEIRAVGEDSDRFFARWSSQVDALLDRLLQEQQQWRGERERIKRELERRAALLDQREQQVASKQADVEAARAENQALEASLDQQQQWQEIVEAIRRDWTTLREFLPSGDAQADGWATVLGELTSTREELARAREELAAAKAEIQRLAQPVEFVVQDVVAQRACEQLSAERDAMRIERDAMRQERDAMRGERDAKCAERLLLEAELDSVRSHAAQLAEALDEQKRNAAEQDAYWRGEFRRQCAIVERLTGPWAQMLSAGPVTPEGLAAHPVQAASATATAGSHEGNANAAASQDSALESLRAQFELLQRDATRRRKENADSVHH